MRIESLDEKDNCILDILKDNARVSYSEIAKEVGLTRVAVANRVREMEDKGIITGYVTRIDETAAAEVILFFLDLETDPAAYGDMMDVLGNESMIKQLYTTSGECRIHAVGLAPNQVSVTRFVNTFYREMKGIRRLSCHTALSTLKDLRSGIHYSMPTATPPKEKQETYNGKSDQTP